MFALSITATAAATATTGMSTDIALTTIADFGTAIVDTKFIIGSS